MHPEWMAFMTTTMPATDSPQPTGSGVHNGIDIGIVGVGSYLPAPRMTAADIADASGIEEWVIREKFGITVKHIPGPDDHTNRMAIYAAQDCLARCQVAPEEIDVVLCATEEWNEYLLWTGGINLAQESGETRAG